MIIAKSDKANIEHFIIKIMILGGVIASSVTTLIQLIALQNFDSSVIVGFVAIIFMSFFLLLTRFNRVVLAGILTTMMLLILMSMELLFAHFLRQTSVATLIVLAFSNSAAYRGWTRISLHAVTFFSLTFWIIFLKDVGFELPDKSSFSAMGINIVGTYLLLGFITYILKKKYDHHISEIEGLFSDLKNKESLLIEKNNEIETMNEELNSLNEELSTMNESLEKNVKHRTKELEIRNTQLTEYAFINSHLLRAPLSRVLGLSYLLTKEATSIKDTQLIEELLHSTNELDGMIRKISDILYDGNDLTREDVKSIIDRNL